MNAGWVTGCGLIPTASNKDPEQVLAITDHNNVKGCEGFGADFVRRTAGYIVKGRFKIRFIVGKELVGGIQLFKFDFVVVGYETRNLDDILKNL